MRYGSSKLKKPEKRHFYGIFDHLNGIKSKYKRLPVEVLQTTLGRNPTSSFRSIGMYFQCDWSQ